MAKASKIEWTDASWNPLVGCSKVSPGCKSCYAETMAARLKAMALKDMADGKDHGRKRHYIDAIDDQGRWSGKLIPVPEALADPLSWRKARMVFVNSMSDLFHENVSAAFISRVFGVMASCPQHTFQVLTKRAECMRYEVQAIYESPKDHDVWPREWWHRRDVAPLPNVWLGVSVEDQPRADERIPWLLKTPAAVRFVSAEPLLGPIDFHLECPGCALCATWPDGRDRWGNRCFNDAPLIDWIIAGGESGPHARPMHPDWARSLRDQCQAAAVAFFFKQWGEWAPEQEGETERGRDGEKERRNARSVPQSLIPSVSMSLPPARLLRLGKAAAGRLLDGREWSEFPQSPTARRDD